MNKSIKQAIDDKQRKHLNKTSVRDGSGGGLGRTTSSTTIRFNDDDEQETMHILPELFSRLKQYYYELISVLFHSRLTSHMYMCVFTFRFISNQQIIIHSAFM